MAYSDDGAHLAVINDKKAVILYSVADNYEVNTSFTAACLYTYTLSQVSHLYFAVLQLKNEYYAHHAKPVSLAWCPDNEHFATGGMDMMVYVWAVSDADKKIKLPGKPRRRHRGRSCEAHASFIEYQRRERNTLDSVLWLSL